MKKALLAVLMFGMVTAANANTLTLIASNMVGGLPVLGAVAIGALSQREAPADSFRMVTCKHANANYTFDTTVYDAKVKGLSCK